MPDRYARPVADDEFRQRVRRHPPSSLLPQVAAASAQYWTPTLWMSSPYRKFTPWNLAEVARVSLMYGNELRGKPPAADDLLECCAAYSAMSDPDLARHNNIDSLAKYMLRISNEQLGYGHSVLNELARTIALLEQTEAPQQLRVLTDDWATQLLACTPAEYVGVAFLLWAAALHSNACFTLNWLDNDDLAPIRDQVDSSRIRQIAADQFIADTDQIRALQRPLPPGCHPDLRRYTFNPLHARPVVSGLVDGLIVPVPHLLVRKASLAGLYYTAVDALGNAFAEDLGWLFEAYVGRQLALLDGATVHPSIKYGPHNGEEGVDWVAVFDDVVLLVEVKSRRPTEAIKIGTDQAAKDLQISLPKAVNQLSTTADLITGGSLNFTDIPTDRPMIGLVVTMEPFYVINARVYRDLLPSCRVPYRLCSAYELERMVTVKSETAGSALLRFMLDPAMEDHAVQFAFTGAEFGRNAVIDAGWDALPWKVRDDVQVRLTEADDSIESPVVEPSSC